MAQGYDQLIDTSSVAKLIQLLGEVPGAARQADQSLKDLGDTSSGVSGGRRRTISGRNVSEDVFLPQDSRGTYDSNSYDGRRREETWDRGSHDQKRRREWSGGLDARTSDDELLKGLNDAFKYETASQVAQSKIEKQIGRGAKKSQEELILDAIMTSRILPGGVLSPLVGRLAKAGLTSLPGGAAEALGAGGAGASATTAIAAAAAAALPLVIGIAGIAGIGAVANAAADRIRTGSNAFWQSGGTPGEIGQILALGGENAGAKAESLGAALRGGGYAAAIARAHGIVDMGDYMTPDKAENYIKTLDLLHGTKDRTERIRLARGLGMQEDAWVSDLSDSTYNALKKSRGGYSVDDEKGEAEYRANKEILGNSWDNLVRSAGTPVMKALNWVWWFAGQIGGDDEGGASKNGSGQTRQTRGGRTDNVARQLKDGPDWSGGGERARAAVPAGVVAQSINDNFEFEKLHLGGFSA